VRRSIGYTLGAAGRAAGIGTVVGLAALLVVGRVETIGHERQPTPTAPAAHQTPTPTPTVLPYAFDLKTGDLIWRNLARQSAFDPNGHGIGWGKVFVQDGDNHLVALDITNGHQLWASSMFGPAGANQPVPFGGHIYTGVPDGEISQDPGQSLKLNKKGTSGYTFGFDQ
jgi:outer membrane protein assembly factor BamB